MNNFWLIKLFQLAFKKYYLPTLKKHTKEKWKHRHLRLRPSFEWNLSDDCTRKKFNLKKIIIIIKRERDTRKYNKKIIIRGFQNKSYQNYEYYVWFIFYSICIFSIKIFFFPRIFVNTSITWQIEKQKVENKVEYFVNKIHSKDLN